MSDQGEPEREEATPPRAARRARWRAGLGALLLVLGGVVAWRLLGTNTGPARCAEGWRALGPRCCAEGQLLVANACRGQPLRCPQGMHAATRGEGCVADAGWVRFQGGQYSLAPGDWQAEGQQAPRELRVATFELARVELTVERWNACQGLPRLQGEPGAPVTGLTLEQAQRACACEGGRLPTSEEWLVAATGGTSRRWPWGPTGLVCRRAAYGLVRGPCAVGATEPELAGARPEGRSPEGALDLSGNVAELTLEPDGSAVARGGSYRAESAAALSTWASEPVSGPQRHVGVRCARTPR